jgi:hypothetical protein
MPENFIENEDIILNIDNESDTDLTPSVPSEDTLDASDNEEIQDLLNTSGEKKIKLCEDVKKGVVCQNLDYM